MTTLKHHIKPLNRKDAALILAAHLRDAASHGDEDIAIPRDDIEALFKYFLPAPPKKAKTAAQWVAKAVSDKKDPREYLRYVYSDGEFLVATDGFRIHWIKSSDYPAGFYCPKSLERVDYGATYPDWKRAARGVDIPKDLASFQLDELPTHTTDTTGKTCYYLLTNSEGEEVGVNSRYLADAANGDKTIRLCLGGLSDVIRGRGEFGCFAVAPLRL